MKYKVLKTILIIIGLIPFIWLLFESMEDYYSSFVDIPNYLVGALINILIYPWVLLGLFPIFIGFLIPFKKDNRVVKKKEKNKKILWKVCFCIGIIPFVIPLLLSVFTFFFGFDFFFSTYYGFEGLYNFLFIW